MSVCCDKPTVSYTIEQEPFIVGDHWQTSHALVPAGLAVSKGDLVKIDGDNLISLATDAGDWDAIASYSITADQANKLNAEGQGMAVINQGEVSVHAVKLAGVKLSAGDYDKAIARGTKLNIELRRVAGL